MRRNAARKLCAAVCVILMGASLGGCISRPSETAPLRDQSAPISSQIDATAKRLAGNWVVRRSWIGAPYLSTEQGSGTAGFRVSEAEGGLQLSGYRFGVDAAKRAEFLAFSTQIKPAGPGRFAEIGGSVFGRAELWVLWMDADNRTVAIGTPNGRFGWIMDRRAKGGQDRLKAASEIMEWMGYDMSNVQGVSQ